MNDLKGIIEDCNKSDLVSDKIIKKVIEIIGQEEWQILHDENNDVCTTMGELIITLKGIAELEKENELLKADFEFNAKQFTKKSQTVKKYQELVDEYSSEGADLQERIKELEQENKVLAQNLEDTEIVNKALEKENAILKEQVSILDNCDRLGDVITEEYKEQLTKAKEIIKELMSFSVQLCDCRHTVDFEKTREEAEQFLNSEEK